MLGRRDLALRWLPGAGLRVIDQRIPFPDRGKRRPFLERVALALLQQDPLISALDDALNDPDDLVARHEAGHAVASYFLRGFIGIVTIDSPAVGKLGGTEVWVLEAPLVDDNGHVVVPNELSNEDQEAFRDAVMITMAGPVAETIYWDFRQYAEVLMKNPDDQAKLDSILRKVWPDRYAEIEAELVESTRSFLKREWAAVERLAVALEEARLLDGKRAAVLIDGA